MAGIQDLPVELILRIFGDVSDDPDDSPSRHIQAFAASCRYIRACFQVNEHHIFSNAAKNLVPAGQGLYELLVKMACLRYDPDRPTDYDEISARLLNAFRGDMEDFLRSGKLMHVLKYLEDTRNLGRRDMSNPAQALPSSTLRVETLNTVHPFDYLFPGVNMWLPPEDRKEAYWQRLQWQAVRHNFHARNINPPFEWPHPGTPLIPMLIKCQSQWLAKEPSFILCKQE